MMNVCESIQGALYDEAAEVVNTLWPKAMRVGKRLDSTFSWSLHSPHYSGHLT
ncbi:hypothetical protein LZS94_09815 [Aliivibrio fischeri]|uniref:hypothetical protein n=1 Tax=Aliivibrio fischeri TaxID=668 RepID=UPI001F240955|nr:hypothetical protein [Aliivibrio fischeri]MCE7577792.1 hypothetical protein [Aliivibrio fischeri]MCE7590180.1 hypothetical protein [Aliivibrio fischeri]